jgi:serine/threonine protein kinase/tetratricopeptide (TPR) repeat protein
MVSKKQSDESDPGLAPTEGLPLDSASANDENISGGYSQIGPYRLLYRLGSGGMGDVWAAQQSQPIRRQVALKIIKAGRDTAEVVRRFEAERQALAVMDHPYVASVFDAGSTPTGRPYFAMELVRGKTIDDYCDSNQLSIPDRLELFLRVCKGVQHAHQRALIHRDLKSSNILVVDVDGRATPKIIDFGLAKAMGPRLTQETFNTGIGEFLGTPGFMSPEQAHLTDQSVDTRSDIYSLGVVLYRILTGVLPLDLCELKAAGFERMLKILREEDPVRPSTRTSSLGEELTQVAGERHTTAGRLPRLLRGDLDWITMKALEKDRERRYDSVGHFAADVRRYLEHRPVLAGPPSRIYQMRKFARRHRTGVALSALGSVAVLVFVVGMAVQSERIRQQATYVRQVADFMTNLFIDFDPVDRGATVTLREILDEGAARTRNELGDQPLVQARLMMTIGSVYRNLDLYEDAGPLLAGAVDLYESNATASELELGTALRELAVHSRILGEYAKADSLYRRAIPILEKSPEGPEYTSALHGLAVLCRYQARYEEAEQLYLRAIEIRRRTLGNEHADVAKVLSDLAVVYYMQPRLDEAMDRTREALVIRQAVLPARHASIGESYNNLGVLARARGDQQEARQYLERALEIRMTALGPDHTVVAQTRINLGAVHEALDELPAALYEQQAALEIYEAIEAPAAAMVRAALAKWRAG